MKVYIDFEFNSFIEESKIINTQTFIEYLTKLNEDNKRDISITYVFNTSEEQIKLNADYLNHDYDTDVITFDYSEKDNEINGEVYISPEKIKENAQEYNETYLSEINRVLIHGYLHLEGYNDKSEEEQSVMREEENKYLDYIQSSTRNI